MGTCLSGAGLKSRGARCRVQTLRSSGRLVRLRTGVPSLCGAQAPRVACGLYREVVFQTLVAAWPGPLLIGWSCRSHSDSVLTVFSEEVVPCVVGVSVCLCEEVRSGSPWGVLESRQRWKAGVCDLGALLVGGGADPF